MQAKHRNFSRLLLVSLRALARGLRGLGAGLQAWVERLGALPALSRHPEIDGWQCLSELRCQRVRQKPPSHRRCELCDRSIVDEPHLQLRITM